MQIRNRAARSMQVALIFSFIFGLFTLFHATGAQAQMRVNDHDMEALMKNLHEDAKGFQPEFDRAVGKSTIRHTSQEKDARDQAAAFTRQTGALLDRFKKTRNGHQEFEDVMTSAQQIDALVGSLGLGPQVRHRWRKIRRELHEIANGYGVPENFGNDADSF